jgi:hypothetical protein
MMRPDFRAEVSCTCPQLIGVTDEGDCAVCFRPFTVAKRKGWLFPELVEAAERIGRPGQTEGD